MSIQTAEDALRRAAGFAQNGMAYADADELAQYRTLRDDAHALVLLGQRQGEHHIHWAAGSAQALLEATQGLHPLRVAFVPEAWLPALQAAGFVITAEFVDFFHAGLKDWQCEGREVEAMRFLPPEQAQAAHEVSLACRLQSRGFEGEPASFFAQWETEQENGRTLAAYKGDTLVGYCCVGTYGEQDRRTLWLREIAVHPHHQGKGHGKRLAQQALGYGLAHGCAKAFLAADVLNRNAIGLYHSLGFAAQPGRGEINLRRP